MNGKSAKRRFGDRSDGRLVRSLTPMAKIMPYIMVKRSDACNAFSDEFRVDTAEKYIREKRENGMPNFSILHLLVAAYVRTVSQRPGLNRFVSGQKVFTRDEIEVNLCIKKEMRLNSPDSVLSVCIRPDATAADVYEIMNAEIEKTRAEDTSFDGTAAAFNRIPGLIKKFVFWMVRVLDYFGLLPSKLTRLSPFHGSLFITSMASLGLPPIYHHIYDLGNVPVFLAFGVTEKRLTPQKDGTFEERRYMKYSLVMDERICDGYYFASSFRLLNNIMRIPDQLDKKPESVIADID